MRRNDDDDDTREHGYSRSRRFEADSIIITCVLLKGIFLWNSCCCCCNSTYLIHLPSLLFYFFLHYHMGYPSILNVFVLFLKLFVFFTVQHFSKDVKLLEDFWHFSLKISLKRIFLFTHGEFWQTGILQKEYSFDMKK